VLNFGSAIIQRTLHFTLQLQIRAAKWSGSFLTAARIQTHLPMMSGALVPPPTLRYQLRLLFAVSGIANATAGAAVVASQAGHRCTWPHPLAKKHRWEFWSQAAETSTYLRNNMAILHYTLLPKLANFGSFSFYLVLVLTLGGKIPKAWQPCSLPKRDIAIWLQSYSLQRLLLWCLSQRSTRYTLSQGMNKISPAILFGECKLYH
jgi:hypothetical protein